MGTERVGTEPGVGTDTRGLSVCSGRRFWGEGGSTLPVVALGPGEMGLMQAAGQGAGDAGTRPGTQGARRGEEGRGGLGKGPGEGRPQAHPSCLTGNIWRGCGGERWLLTHVHTRTRAQDPQGRGWSVGMGACSRASAHVCPYMCAHTCGLGGLHTCVGAHAWLGHGHGADVCTWAHTRVNGHVQMCTHVCIHSHVLQHTRAWEHAAATRMCTHAHACTMITLIAHILARSCGHPLVVLCPGGT